MPASVQEQQLIEAIHHSFIEAQVADIVSDYKPRLVFNDKDRGERVLSVIEDDLLACQRYDISVAFVTHTGVEPLLSQLEEIDRRGVPGRILTTDYLTFTEPQALRVLKQLKNVEIRMYRCNGREGFHTKGYMFGNGDIVRILIGSSNWTGAALCTNREWNTHVVTKDKGEFSQQLQNEFNELWNSPVSQTFDQFIDEYTELYKSAKAKRKVVEEEIETETVKLTPNTMQMAFVDRLMDLYNNGEKKALLISATGTGKTYAAAFGIQKLAPKRMLFLVHREQICLQAMKSFKRVLGSDLNCGVVSGNQKDWDKDFVFATMQTFSKEESLKRYSKDAFDVIVIDEVHRAGAPSYQKIMDYFDPKLWLGMTASPDRTDDFDIYGLFDHNIVYEIRLQTALEENLLCPFHYFGISDLWVDGVKLDDEEAFRQLTSEERVRHILDRANFFQWSGDRVRGLVFCSRKEEAKELAKRFNLRGYPSVALSGDDDQGVREEAIRRLTEVEGDNRLEYIFTVDIFNEGVDIPEVNQVILLRPTQSPIVFIQQLGRGLRKAEGKEFVVVIDFIANYDNNYLIPIALSGDTSYDKDNMRRFVQVGRKRLPGVSTINFDRVSRERIFKSIDTAKTNTMQLLRQSYQTLKFKLGRLPSLLDFEEHQGIDGTKFIEKKGSYYAFRRDYDKDYTLRLDSRATMILEYISTRLCEGMRMAEVLAVESLLKASGNIRPDWVQRYTQFHQFAPTEQLAKSVALFLECNFWLTKGERDKHTDAVLIDEIDGEWTISNSFKMALNDNPMLADEIMELLEFARRRYAKKYNDRYKDFDLVLYQKYTYQDVCRLLNWTANVNGSSIGGYIYRAETKHFPVFINYDKAEDAIAYHDRFNSPSELIALSKKPRKVDSLDADHIYKRTEADQANRILLFVRKNKDDQEAKAFYFLGEINAVGEPLPVKVGPNQENGFEITYHLEQPVTNEIYQYITSGI